MNYDDVEKATKMDSLFHLEVDQFDGEDNDPGKVFSFEKMKNNKNFLENITHYKSYIQMLTTLETQQEIDYQLSQINLEIYDRLHFCKIDSIISILENKSTPEAAHLIRKIRNEIYQRVKDFYQV